MSNKKNITNTIDFKGHYIFVLGGLTIGGAEKVAHFVMQGLIDRERKVLLITRKRESEDHYRLAGEHDRIVMGGEGESENKFIGLLKNLDYIRRLRKILKVYKNSTIVTFLTRPNIYTIAAEFGLGNMLIICERNDTTKQTHGWPWDTLRKRLYKYANVVTANSEVAINGMKPYVSEKKLVYIPNPVKLPPESLCAEPDKSNLLLNVGRMVPAKNQTWLINVFASMYKSYPKWSLSILGDGDRRNEIESRVDALNIENAVSLPGFINNTSEYYRKAAIFVLPSHFEGTPNAMLEAMSYGLPCIVSDALPGAMELIEDVHSGLIYSHNSSDQLLEKIQFLIENPGIRKKMGKKARSTLRKFSPERIVEDWVKILDAPR